MSAHLNHEALQNAANLASDLFDNQGWPLGELSAQDIAEKIIRRYLEMAAYFREKDEEVVAEKLYEGMP